MLIAVEQLADFCLHVLDYSGLCVVAFCREDCRGSGPLVGTLTELAARYETVQFVHVPPGRLELLRPHDRTLPHHFVVFWRGEEVARVSCTGNAEQMRLALEATLNQHASASVSFLPAHD